ncbi:hypothetical protein CVT26_012264 [Gymnopilus dilepis]|uniref:WSC domain-containing protein n=1 Tax=Gymnopilus dilepis TaxID=231916 RepID=A0A409YQ98_9AGAR|nr:hypothetical protein CVT26_012264 [Gymnopilus dilepis]
MPSYLIGVLAGALLGLKAHAQGTSAAPAIPAVLPAGWTSVGCFTYVKFCHKVEISEHTIAFRDVSTSRTLAATNLVQNPMTIETCIAFCSSGGFIFAGVEFGDCDSTIQVPSQPAPATDCDMACSGNPAELCGGPVRVNVFQSNATAPVIVQSVTQGTGVWSFEGCFTDSVAARTLGTGVNIPGGTTAESCTAACQAAGGFTFAGLENGHECWCDNAIHDPAQRVADADCKELCQSTHFEFCGNANRVAVYEFFASGQPTGPQACLQNTVGNFTLRAQFKNPPVSGPSILPLKVIAVEMVQNTIWTILSACANCCSEWLSLSLNNQIINPHSIVVPTQAMASTFTNQGESPNFVASIPAFPGSQSFCTMTDPTAPSGSPPLLAFNGIANGFSLCTNTSANARVDVVFSPVTNHPHYSIDSCQPINIQVSERNQSCRQGTGSASDSRFTVPFIYTPSFLSSDSEIPAILSLLVQLLMYSLFFALFIYVWLLRSNFARLYYLYQL